MPSLLTDKVLNTLRVPANTSISLDDYDPEWQVGDELSVLGKQKEEAQENAAEILQANLERLAKAQDKLYADNRYSLLFVLQALDAAGKDGTIKHVMSGINPQGCHVTSFKRPSEEELDHDFLWRCNRVLPARGMIGIFNRSYYEEVLVVRVHPEFLKYQRLPGLTEPNKKFWQQRYESINNFEQHLHRNGTRIVKIFLNVSKKEQKKRFLERLTNPAKNWKFNSGDLVERKHWNDYRSAYAAALSATSTEHAPWYVVPADQKWVTRAIVAEILADTIESLGVSYPQPPAAELQKFAEYKQGLEAE